MSEWFDAERHVERAHELFEARRWDEAEHELRRALSEVSLPNAVVMQVHAGEGGVPALPAPSPAHGKAAIEGKPTAYVCLGPQCSLPVTEPAKLAETARAARSVATA